MANADRPKGCAPYGAIIRESPYQAGGTVYPGDVVTLNSSGQIVAASAGTNPNIGVAVHYATSGNDVMVWDDPNQKFVIQSDDGTTFAQTAIGLNYNLTATAGNATYKQSRMELTSNSGATDSNLPFRLLGVTRAVDNVIGEFSQCVVDLNNHQLRAGVVGN